MAWRFQTLIRVTSGSPLNARWISGPSRAAVSGPGGWDSSGASFSCSTSRRTSAAVFSHSQSDTARASREESAKAMPRARMAMQSRARAAKRLVNSRRELERNHPRRAVMSGP